MMAPRQVVGASSVSLSCWGCEGHFWAHCAWGCGCEREYADGFHAFVIFPFGQSADAWDFVAELWATPTPSGKYRYYDGMLYMLGWLQLAGQFRYHAPAPLVEAA